MRWQQHGDRRAREEMVERFMPLARRLARRYMSQHETSEDLLQVAALGLVGAVDRFDPSRGVKFSAFAVPTILGELKRHFRNTGWAVHVPRRAQEMALLVDRAAEQLAARSGRAPRPEDLAEHLEMSIEDVLIGLEAGSAHYSASLDAPTAGVDDEMAETLGDRLGSEDDRFALVEASLAFSAAIKRLPYLERHVLSLRIGQDMKQTDIARHIGCSQMQVSRLLRRAASDLQRLTDPAARLEGARICRSG